MKITNINPVWVLGNDEINLVRITIDGNYVSNRDFSNCSQWTNREGALEFAKKFKELKLYKMEEIEDGRERSIIKFSEEKI